jgi:hypothetical protein
MTGSGTINGVSIGQSVAGAGSFTTLSSSGNTTFTNAPVLSSLTASQAVFTTAGKALTSNAITGTGNVVMSASPTLTGTISAAAATLSGNLTLSGGTANGVLYLDGSKVATSGSVVTYNGTTFGVDSAAVFNESGANVDFRVEGDTDANLLFVDASADAVGIGTSSPAQKLDVVGNIRAAQTGATSLVISNVNTPGTSYSSQFQLQIDGTYYGLVGAAGYAGLLTTGSASGDMVLRTNTRKILFSTDDGATTSLTLNTSGNLGLGVTPSAWGASVKAIQIGSYSNIYDISGNTSFGNNFYYNGTNSLYLNSTQASIYQQSSGQHRWYTAPIGTAGNAITFTQAMTLDASGKLYVGGTTGGERLNLENGGTDSTGIRMAQTGTGGRTYFVGSTGSGYPGGAGALVFYDVTASAERARITSGGNFQTSSGNSVMIGGTAARATTAGTNRLDIFDGTAPVGTLANGVSFYSTAGEARVMDAAGNATLLSPHDARTNEWIFHSKHTPTGKVLRIDVERLLKFVNDHFGLDAVQEFIEP